MITKMRFRPRRIFSGGQTGADRGGWDAAIALGIPYGGYVPRGRKAEDGKIPECYVGEITETEIRDYPTRTKLNIVHSDGTIIFYDRTPTHGSTLTSNLAFKLGKPRLLIDISWHWVAIDAKVIDWLINYEPMIINIAGSRESKCPGIQKRVRDLLVNILR